MSQLEETVNKAIRDTIDFILGSPEYTIRAKQPGMMRPIGAYSSVALLSDINIGWEQYILENQPEPALDLISTMEGVREMTYSVNFFRDNSYDNARKVRTMLTSEAVKELWRVGEIGLISRSQIRDLSEALDGKTWEERAQLDIKLSIVGSEQEIVTSILSANISGQYLAHNTNTQFSIEV